MDRHAGKSSRNRFHPYTRASTSTSGTSPEIVTREPRSDATDVKCAGDSKLNTKFEIPKAFEADNELRDRKCVICLDTQPHVGMQSLPCGHAFHSACISEWLKKKTRCPVCRNRVIPIAEDMDSDESDDEDAFLNLQVYENDHDSEGDHGNLGDDEEDLYEVDDDESDGEYPGVYICATHLRSGNCAHCPIHGNRVRTDVDETDDEDELEDLESSSIQTKGDKEDVDTDDSFNAEYWYPNEVDEESESDQDSDESDDSDVHPPLL